MSHNTKKSGRKRRIRFDIYFKTFLDFIFSILREIYNSASISQQGLILINGLILDISFLSPKYFKDETWII